MIKSDIIKQLKEQAGEGLSYLVNSYPLKEGDVIDCKDNCFFKKPPTTGKVNPLISLTIDEINLSIENKTPYLGTDLTIFSDGIHIALNEDTARTNNGHIEAACFKLGKNGYCTTNVIFRCCPYYKREELKRKQNESATC